MKTTIKDKYISPGNCSYLHSRKSCPFHEVTNKEGSDKVKVLYAIISYIKNHLSNSNPVFWKSFNELSSWYTLKNIRLVFCTIWLIKACINWINNGEDNEYSDTNIVNLQMD